MLPTKFRFIWPNGFRGEESKKSARPNGFRGEDSKKSANRKQESPVVAMFVNGSGWIEQSLIFIEDLRQMLPTKFRIIWPSSFRGEYFQKSTNQKQELPMMAMFVNGSKWNEQFPQRTFHRCFLPRFGSFSQAVSEQKIFRNRPIRNNNCLWRPCLLMDLD